MIPYSIEFYVSVFFFFFNILNILLYSIFAFMANEEKPDAVLISVPLSIKSQPPQSASFFFFDFL